MKKLIALLLLAALLAGCAADHGPVYDRCPHRQAHHGTYHGSDHCGHAAAYHSAH